MFVATRCREDFVRYSLEFLLHGQVRIAADFFSQFGQLRNFADHFEPDSLQASAIQTKSFWRVNRRGGINGSQQSEYG